MLDDLIEQIDAFAADLSIDSRRAFETFLLAQNRHFGRKSTLIIEGLDGEKEKIGKST